MAFNNCCRTLDGLHVACALELKAERFWTFDRPGQIGKSRGPESRVVKFYFSPDRTPFLNKNSFLLPEGRVTNVAIT